MLQQPFYPKMKRKKKYNKIMQNPWIFLFYLEYLCLGIPLPVLVGFGRAYWPEIYICIFFKLARSHNPPPSPAPERDWIYQVRICRAVAIFRIRSLVYNPTKGRILQSTDGRATLFGLKCMMTNDYGQGNIFFIHRQSIPSPEINIFGGEGGGHNCPNS